MKVEVKALFSSGDITFFHYFNFKMYDYSVSIIDNLIWTIFSDTFFLSERAQILSPFTWVKKTSPQTKRALEE